MSLVVQNQIDFTSTLIKGFNGLKNIGTIDFDYYTVKPFYLGGNEIMLVDQVVELIKSLKFCFDRKLDVLLISDVNDDYSDYYLYFKNQKFSEEFFGEIKDLKPLYTHMLTLEQEWEKYGLELSTFNVSDCDDCCLLVSFNSKARSV